MEHPARRYNTTVNGLDPLKITPTGRSPDVNGTPGYIAYVKVHIFKIYIPLNVVNNEYYGYIFTFAGKTFQLSG